MSPFGTLLKRTWSVFTRSFGTFSALSSLYMLVPLLMIGGMATAVGLFAYMASQTRTMPGNTLSAAIAMLPVVAVIPMMLWAVFAAPLFNGAVVSATGHALSGTVTGFAQACRALRGGRYKQLLVISLCAMLMASGPFGGVSNAISASRSMLGNAADSSVRSTALALGMVGVPLTLAFSVVTMLRSLLLSLSVPVAMYENKRHFHALVRSIRCAARRFGVLLGGYVLFAMCFIGVFMLLALIITIAIMFQAYMLAAVMALCAVAVMVMALPLPLIFYTVVYRDVRDSEGYTQFLARDGAVL